MPIRVSLIEDNTAFRETTKRLIDAAPDLRCVSTHPNSEHALRHLPPAAPEVVLADIRMPRLTGIECVRRLRELLPRLLPIMLTSYGEDELIFQSLQAGAVGYLLKRAAPATILAAVREVHAGGSPMTPEIARKVALHFRQNHVQDHSAHGLTPRELEVLQFVAQGKQSKEIADVLGIARPTVHNHLRHIYEKLHVSSRIAAVAKVFPR